MIALLVHREVGEMFYFIFLVGLCYFSLFFATEKKHRHRVCVFVAPNAHERILSAGSSLLSIGIEFAG